MSDSKKLIEDTFAFARYLSWADLQKTLFETETDIEPVPTEPTAVRKHEWRRFGLMCYWYASLHIVTEAWDQLKFSDPVIDQLLTHPKDFRKLLRRYRNSVFHFQRSVIDRKILYFLAEGAAHVYWIHALHIEFVRFFAEYLAGQFGTDELLTEIRDGIEEIVNWLPHRETPAIESLEHMLTYGRELLAQYPDDDSELRKEVERSLTSAEAALREGRHNWATLRAEILREAGVK